MSGNNKDARTETPAPAIEFRHVSLSFGDVVALNDVSFALPHGEMWIITGASGSGKSVLLHVAIELYRPDAGQVFIDGREIENLDERELLDIRGNTIGIVFQDDALFTGLSVYDNVAFRLVEHGVSEEETDRLVKEGLQFVGLQTDADKMPEEMSGGMKRRLEFARAIVGYPPIMLFDEPTSGLDPLNAGQMLDLIIRARDMRGISALYVTKAMREIDYLATHRAVETATGEIEIRETSAPDDLKMRVMLLEAGKIAWTGSAKELQASALPAVTFMTHAGSDED
jgi:phospholipid/cholesterol/gamma-HCH transport system ATP-binding protein